MGDVLMTLAAFWSRSSIKTKFGGSEVRRLSSGEVEAVQGGGFLAA